MDYNKALRFIRRAFFIMFLNVWVAFGIPRLAHSTLSQITSLDNQVSWPILDIVFWVLTLVFITLFEHVRDLHHQVKTNHIPTTKTVKEDLLACLYMNLIYMTVATVIMYFWRDDYPKLLQLLTS